MSDDGLLLYSAHGCLFKIPSAVQPPKAGTLFFSRSLTFTPGEHVLEVGCGAGVTAVLAAKAGSRVIAIDIVPECVVATRENAVLNGVADLVEVRLGDCYAPVAGLTFDLICANPPQMPTPPGRARDDPVAMADNGGPDGWKVLNEVIEGAAAHLRPAGRLVFTIFGFLGPERALRKTEEAGLTPEIVARETQSFPRIGYERIEYLRLIDDEGTIVPTRGLPKTVERLILCGTKR